MFGRRGGVSHLCDDDGDMGGHGDTPTGGIHASPASAAGHVVRDGVIVWSARPRRPPRGGVVNNVLAAVLFRGLPRGAKKAVCRCCGAGSRGDASGVQVELQPYVSEDGTPKKCVCMTGW